MSMLEKRDRVLMLPALEERMRFMHKEIEEAEEEVSLLLRKYEKESRDVERLQNDSFSAFLFRLAGRYEDKLEKEQREEINAKIEYDRAITHHKSLIDEKEDLANQIAELKVDKQKFHSELDKRRRELSDKLSEPDGIRFNQIEKEREDIISQIARIEQSLRAASRAKSTAQTVAKSLSSARGWATFDTFTRGGIITHMAKYSHIDEAEGGFNMLSHDLRELNVELGNVDGFTTSGLSNISSGQRMVDFWFDNIFTNLSVLGQIKDNANQIDSLIWSISSIESALKEKRNGREKELAENKKQEEELLLSINQGF